MSRTVERGVQFGILGSLRVTVDGREVSVDSPKQRRLLAVLLVEVGTVVSTDRLAEALWGDHQPEDPSGAVQTHVSRLRGLLDRGSPAGASDVLATRPPGYVLAVDPDGVDAGRFERLVEEARAAGTPEVTADLLRAALGLWRGRPLEEFDHEPVRAEATRLEELRTRAVELRADALLTLGRYAEVVGELEPAVARHPLREQLRGQLMVALDRCGRRADALAAYRELRDGLVTELGVEPSAALRRLERAILQQADLPWPAPTTEVEVAGGRSRGSRPRSWAATTVLPEALTSFVGREADVRGVAAVLAERRVVVLTGAGGVGKSRLAVRVARELAEDYADGVVPCDLVSADESRAVTDVVATALGVLPAEHAGAEDAVVEFLRSQQLLLVLDNCEHVLAGASSLVNRVARTCPAVDVLATSRQPLGVAGQQIWPVTPLQVGDEADGAAVELFCDRAAAADPAFELTDADRDAVMEICQRVDGLPLGVELAAARVRSMTPADIADRVDHRFDLLTADTRTAPPRHQSLQAVVDWSYALLPGRTQRLFDRLAVFAGGFGMDAAEQVCAGDGLPVGEVAGRLAELVDHSLVAVDRSGRYARYRLLETLRAYGRARLEESGELPAWRHRHAEHYTALAGEAAAGLEGTGEAGWVRTVDAELANLRSAQAWARANGQVDLALALPARLRVYAYYRLRDEVYDWAFRALDLPGASERPAYPAALVAAGVGWMQRGRLERAREHGEAVLAAAPDEAVALRTLQLLTEVAQYRGRPEETGRWGDELVDRARAVGSPYYEALGHALPAYAALYTGRRDEATARLEEARRLVGTVGNPSLLAACHHLEGEVLLDVDPQGALAALRESVEIARSVGNRFIEGVARVSAASVGARHGEPDEALAAFREVVDHWRTSGDWVHMWTTLHNLLVLFERVGAHEPAAVLLGAVETATTGAPAYGADARRLETAAASLRGSLGEQVLAAAEARGRNMTDDEAVVHALAEIDRLLADGPADVAGADRPEARSSARAGRAPGPTGGPPAPGGPGPPRPCGTA